MLPELPLDQWLPASRDPDGGDCEPPAGDRHTRLGRAAATVGLAVIGGVIVRDPSTGARHNTALVFDAHGSLIGSYRKLHLPEELGFWETSHYLPGTEPPERIDGLPMPFGVQLCSDANRPTGSLLLGALGAELIAVPRATEAATWPRWRTVLTANALTSCCYVLSVPRPRPEAGVALGGPSIAIAPDGEILLETEDALGFVDLDRARVATARRSYPGYLAQPATVYAAGWLGANDSPRPKGR